MIRRRGNHRGMRQSGCPGVHGPFHDAVGSPRISVAAHPPRRSGVQVNAVMTGGRIEHIRCTARHASTMRIIARTPPDRLAPHPADSMRDQRIRLTQSGFGANAARRAEVSRSPVAVTVCPQASHTILISVSCVPVRRRRHPGARVTTINPRPPPQRRRTQPTADSRLIESARPGRMSGFKSSRPARNSVFFSARTPQ
jgi:hypothetical protein